jgi:hypothetical protein
VEYEGKKIWKYLNKNGLSEITYESKIKSEQYPLLSAGVLENKVNLDYFLIQVKGYNEGKLHSNTTLGWSLKNIYGTIIKILYNDYNKKHRKFVKKFVRVYRNNEELVEDFFDLPEWKEFYDFHTKVETMENSEFWYMVYYICEIYKGMNTEFKYEEFTDLGQLAYMSSFEWDAIKKRDETHKKYYSHMYPSTLIFKTEMILNNIEAGLITSGERYVSNQSLDTVNFNKRNIQKNDIQKIVKENNIIYSVKNKKILFFTKGTQPEKLFAKFYSNKFEPINLMEIHREVFSDSKEKENLSTNAIKKKIKGIKFSKNYFINTGYKVSTCFVNGTKEFSLTVEKVK